MDLALGLRTPAGEGRRFVLTVVTGRAYSSGRTTEPVGEGIRVREEAVRLHPDTHNRNIIYNHFQPNKNSKLMVGSARVFDGPKWSTTGWCARVAKRTCGRRILHRISSLWLCGNGNGSGKRAAYEVRQQEAAPPSTGRTD